MGIFDDAVPGGGIAKPLMIALGALLVGKMAGSFGQSPSSSAADASRESNAGGLGGLFQGGLAGGLGGLLDRLTSSGHGNIANSWVQPGANAPIQPDQLRPALGQTTISDLARQSGMSEQEVLSQLSRVLPGVVDKLTPGGRIPDQAEIASQFSR